MKGQWTLAKKIIDRYRELGIAGHLPAFAGYAPWALAIRQNDTKKVNGSHPYPATRGTKNAFDTAWVDGRDPLFTTVADAWMKQILTDFGTDHVWQMDGFFGSGTGWGQNPPLDDTSTPSNNVTCEWSAANKNSYLKGCAHGNAPYHPLGNAPDHPRGDSTTVLHHDGRGHSVVRTRVGARMGLCYAIQTVDAAATRACNQDLATIL